MLKNFYQNYINFSRVNHKIKNNFALYVLLRRYKKTKKSYFSHF